MKHIRKIASVICIILSLIIVMLSFSSCVILDYLFNYQGYSGEHTDLYTVAVNNIFAIDGFTNNGEAVYDPGISIIEKDDYGRILFFYNEIYGQCNSYEAAFVIMQKSEDGYVYYYQDDCYTPATLNFDEYYYPDADQGITIDELINTATELSSEAIEELKAANSWNLEFCEDKCTKTKINKNKPEGKGGINNIDFEIKFSEYLKENGYENSDDIGNLISEFCNSDTEEKRLYYITFWLDEARVEYAVIVKFDKENFNSPIIENKAIVQIKDPSDAYELIKELKEQNDWK